MVRILMNDIETSTTLSSEQQKAVHGGFGYYSPWGYIPYYAPRSRYASGYGGFNNVFSRGSVGYGIQAGTFGMQASFAASNAAWSKSFNSGW